MKNSNVNFKCCVFSGGDDPREDEVLLYVRYNKLCSKQQVCTFEVCTQYLRLNSFCSPSSFAKSLSETVRVLQHGQVGHVPEWQDGL